MLKLRSTIQRVVFDVSYFEQETAPAIQNKIISDFTLYSEKKIGEIIEKYTAGFQLKTKTLEIDLGVISLEECKSNLSKLIEQEMVRLFSGMQQKIKIDEIPIGMEVVSIDKNVYSLLLSYLNYGILPWELKELSDEESLEFWFEYLKLNAPDLYKSLLPLLEKKSPRTRFLQLFPIHKEEGLLLKILPDEFHFLAQQQISILNDFVELAGPEFKTVFSNSQYGHYILKIMSKAMFAGYKTYTLKQTVHEIIDHILDTLGSDYLQKLPVELIKSVKTPVDLESDLYKELNLQTFQIISLPVGFIEGESKPLLIDEWIKKHLKKFQKEATIILQELFGLYTKLFPTIDRRELESFLVKKLYQPLVPVTTVEDFELWGKQTTTALEEQYGQGISEKGQELMQKTIDKIDKTDTDQPSRLKEYLEIKIVLHGEITLVPWSEFSRIVTVSEVSGIYALRRRYKDPYQLIYKVIEFLKDKEKRIYSQVIRKISTFVTQIDLLELIDAGASKDIIAELRKYSGKKYLKYGAKSDMVDYGRALIIEVFTSGYVPTVVLHELGQAKVSRLIYFYCESEGDDLQILSSRYQLKLSKGSRAYLERVLDPKYADKILNEFFSYPMDDQDSVVISKAINLSNFQIALNLFFKDNIEDIHIDRFIQMITDLIVVRSNDLAGFLLSLTDDKIKKIKDILPNDYKIKVDELLRGYNLKFQQRIEEEEKPEQMEEGEPLYINNAGVVLLSSYFARLFTMLNITDDKKFKNKNAQSKAIQVIQYLSTGHTDFQEADVLLNKILTGWSLSEAIAEVDPLTTKEKELCDSLLEAVIKNWGVLKKTSIEGLRGTFLMRNGRLLKAGDAWQLLVERKTYDILIDKLPWTYSTIKLPWMQNTLFTEW